MEKERNIIMDANSNVRVYFVKKVFGKGEHSAVIFPNAIEENIKSNYQENFNNFTMQKGIREYDGVHRERDTIQTVSTSTLEVWKRINAAIKVADEKKLFLNQYNFTDDYSLIVVMFEKKIKSGIEKVYLIAKYRKTDTWYKKSIKYTYSGGILKKADNEIYILNGCIDAVISTIDTYILMQSNFESIFNYYKKAELTLLNNKDNMKNWAFLDSPLKFFDCIKGKKGATIKIARALEKSIEKLNSLKPSVVKSVLLKYDKFKDIQFDKNNRIIVTDKNRDLIIDILLNVYAKNLFTDELINTKGS